MFDLFYRYPRIIAAQERKAKKEQRSTYFDTMHLHPGHTLFDLDMNTGILREIPIQRIADINDASIRKTAKIDKEDHVYMPFLNWKVAVRKLRKKGYIVNEVVGKDISQID